MKEAYWSEDDIEYRARAMIQWVREKNPAARDYSFFPGKLALLVTDMQNYFLEPESHAFIPSALPIITVVNDLIQAFELREMPVILTRHTNNEENAGSMKRWWKDMIRPGSEASLLHKDIRYGAAEILIKHQYDAFHDTSLESVLNKHGISQLVIAGVMANLCCETTARMAFVRGYEVFLPVDATASYNEDLHQGSLLNLSFGFSHIMTTREMINQLPGL